MTEPVLPRCFPPFSSSVRAEPDTREKGKLMTLSISRSRLLAGAALGFGLALVPQQAMAQCAVSPAATPVTGTVTCADTTTTDTTYAGVSPSVHRNYNVDTSAGSVTGTVSAGSVVDGFGLA